MKKKKNFRRIELEIEKDFKELENLETDVKILVENLETELKKIEAEKKVSLCEFFSMKISKISKISKNFLCSF